MQGIKSTFSDIILYFETAFCIKGIANIGFVW